MAPQARSARARRVPARARTTLGFFSEKYRSRPGATSKPGLDQPMPASGMVVTRSGAVWPHDTAALLVPLHRFMCHTPSCRRFSQCTGKSPRTDEKNKPTRSKERHGESMGVRRREPAGHALLALSLIHISEPRRRRD
jgi:hypothetical protein